jgi:hypothetical protein
MPTPTATADAAETTKINVAGKDSVLKYIVSEDPTFPA